MLAPSVWKPTAAGPSAVYWVSDDIGFSCGSSGDTGSLPLVDIAGLATCNDEVAADGAGDTDADVIVSGREPRQRPWRPGPLIWLLVIAETAALAVWVAIAVHDRGPAGGVPR